MQAGEKTLLSITVSYSPQAGQVDEVVLALPEGATVIDALQNSGLLDRYPGLTAAALNLGIWGKRCEAGDRLADRDRVEVYRPLQLDPMEARRLRDRRQRKQARRNSGQNAR